MTKQKNQKLSLAETHPELAKEWHPTKNGDLRPEDVTEGSGRKIWWYLPYDDPITGKHFDFEWKAVINHRSRGSGCPYLLGKAVWKGFNDLATLRPDLAMEWHPTKNGDLKPENVTVSSNQKVWWYLPYDDPITGKHFDFEWKVAINHRSRGNGCPYLSGKEVWTGFNDLATLRPDLAMEWHPTKNENLKPSDVTCGSNQKVWWYLPYDDPITGKHFDFEWESKIGNRTILNRNCPYLTGQAVWVGFNDLATLRPDLAKEWHLTKNGDLKPKDVTVSSNQKVWWRIQYTDPENRVLILEWETTVAHRALEGTKHPYMNAPKSERFIYNFLLDNNIDFQFEYTINVVHNNRKRLSFDFYLPNDRLIIEYDGEQHFVNRRHFGTYSFEKVVNRDSIKNKYCKDNGIPILRIPYIFDPTKQESEIKDMILQFLQDRQVPDAILDFYANQKDHNYYDVAMKLNAMNKAT